MNPDLKSKVSAGQAVVTLGALKPDVNIVVEVFDGIGYGVENIAIEQDETSGSPVAVVKLIPPAREETNALFTAIEDSAKNEADAELVMEYQDTALSLVGTIAEERKNMCVYLAGELEVKQLESNFLNAKLARYELLFGKI